MSRRARVIRNSHMPNSRQGNTSRRSNDEISEIENQNNGVGRRNNDHRFAGGNSCNRGLQAPTCQIPLAQHCPHDTTQSLGIDCLTEPESDSLSSQLSKSHSQLTARTSRTRSICRSEQTNEECTLLSLPDDVLFLIFSYLQPRELCLLCCVCRRFQHLTSKDTVWIEHAKSMVIVKQKHYPNCRPCSVKELCRVAPNWTIGRFKEGFAVKYKHRAGFIHGEALSYGKLYRSYLTTAEDKDIELSLVDRLIPWVQKNEDGLWLSMGSSIRCFESCASGHLQEDKDKCLRGLKEDATRFVVKKDRVVSGCRDGSVCCWEVSGTALFRYQQVHRSDTQCVDFTDSVIITGSRDTTCKILPMAPSNIDDPVLQSFDAGERVWSLKISPCESFFAAGLAGCLDDPPVIMWDIESGECLGQLSMNHRRGAGVLDLRFESPSELLTCGYDTFIRMWDLRTQTCVRQWEEPHDSALYCIDSDGSNAILVGTARHGMVRLWDKRKTEPVKVYYSNSRSSPVYSLAMDYGHLYLALDVGLNVLDFTCRSTDTLTAGCSSCLQVMTGRENSYQRHPFTR